ncbi:MAG: hypothetical protein ACRD88_09520 [Terriglobia bacterium]
MAHPQIATFARLAEGPATATRAVSGQKSLLGRTMHGIRYDAMHDEIVVPQQFGQAIMTFRGGANGEEPPLRVIQGPLTMLHDPDRVDIDPIHNEILVPEDQHILVFAREANGNVAPIRVLRSAGNSMGEANVDAVRNLIVVGGSTRVGDRRSDALLTFNRTDQGDVKPRTMITGPRTRFHSGARMAINADRGLAFGTIRDGELVSSDKSFVGVWNYVEDKGDAPPRWTIGGPGGMLRQPRGVALDPRNKTLLVSDKYLNAVISYYFPEVF